MPASEHNAPDLVDLETAVWAEQDIHRNPDRYRDAINWWNQNYSESVYRKKIAADLREQLRNRANGTSSRTWDKSSERPWRYENRPRWIFIRRAGEAADSFLSLKNPVVLRTLGIAQAARILLLTVLISRPDFDCKRVGLDEETEFGNGGLSESLDPFPRIWCIGALTNWWEADVRGGHWFKLANAARTVMSAAAPRDAQQANASAAQLEATTRRAGLEHHYDALKSIPAGLHELKNAPALSRPADLHTSGFAQWDRDNPDLTGTSFHGVYHYGQTVISARLDGWFQSLYFSLKHATDSNATELEGELLGAATELFGTPTIPLPQRNPAAFKTLHGQRRYGMESLPTMVIEMARDSSGSRIKRFEGYVERIGRLIYAPAPAALVPSDLTAAEREHLRISEQQAAAQDRDRRRRDLHDPNPLHLQFDPHTYLARFQQAANRGSSPLAQHSGQGKLGVRGRTVDEKASNLFNENYDLTHEEIAGKIGCHLSTVKSAKRCPNYHKARAMAAVPRTKGWKSRDGNMDAGR